MIRWIACIDGFNDRAVVFRKECQKLEIMRVETASHECVVPYPGYKLQGRPVSPIPTTSVTGGMSQA